MDRKLKERAIKDFKVIRDLKDIKVLRVINQEDSL
jgi:hypothetical protein